MVGSEDNPWELVLSTTSPGVGLGYSCFCSFCQPTLLSWSGWPTWRWARSRNPNCDCTRIYTTFYIYQSTVFVLPLTLVHMFNNYIRIRWFSPSCALQGLNSSNQTWWPVSLWAEPSVQAGQLTLNSTISRISSDSSPHPHCSLQGPTGLFLGIFHFLCGFPKLFLYQSHREGH